MNSPRAALALALSLALAPAACKGSSPSGSQDRAARPPGSAAPGEPYVVGMVFVGPVNDKGWNEAHMDGIRAALARIPGGKLEYVDKVNPSDRPNVKGTQVADDLIARGARVVIFNSDDYKDDALESARKHRDVVFIHISGDYAWKEGKSYKGQENLGNLMGRIEQGKMIAGCAAALGTEAGKIGYLGPLINDETRRLVSSAYLGARHCWEKYRGKRPEELTFKVTWIGFWFNIPGVTLDPTKVADDYYGGGFDVIMTGLDTPEAAVQSRKAAEAGKRARYVHYDHKGGCEIAPDLCLGVPYYNWAPSYLDILQRAREGKYAGEFAWPGPDYKDLNGEASVIGFVAGKALGERRADLDRFIQELAGGLELFKGPLRLQGGAEYLKAGEVATPQQIWYLPGLVEGITGAGR